MHLGRGEKGAACRPRTAASGEASLAGTLAAEPWPPGPGGDEFCRVSPRPGASVIAALADFSRGLLHPCSGYKGPVSGLPCLVGHRTRAQQQSPCVWRVVGRAGTWARPVRRWLGCEM